MLCVSCSACLCVDAMVSKQGTWKCYLISSLIRGGETLFLRDNLDCDSQEPCLPNTQGRWSQAADSLCPMRQTVLPRGCWKTSSPCGEFSGNFPCQSRALFPAALCSAGALRLGPPCAPAEAVTTFGQEGGLSQTFHWKHRVSLAVSPAHIHHWMLLHQALANCLPFLSGLCVQGFGLQSTRKWVSSETDMNSCQRQTSLFSGHNASQDANSR